MAIPEWTMRTERSLRRPPAEVTESRPVGPGPRLGRTGPFIFAVDAVMSLVAVSVAVLAGLGPEPSGRALLLMAGGVALAFGLLHGGGSYQSRLHLSALDELPGVLGRILVAAAAAELVGLGLGVSQSVQVFAVVAGAIVTGRVASYAVIHQARRRGLARHRTLIVGAGAVGTGLVEQLLDNPQYGLKPVAFYDPHPLLVQSNRSSEIPIIRSGSVADAIAESQAGVVIVAFMSVREASLVSVIRQCDRMRTEILCVPRLFELSSDEGLQMDRIGSIPLLRLRRRAHRTRAWTGKRIFDVGLAAVALILLAPLLVGLAIGVLVTDGRPILFGQERLGKDERPFRMLKFRSLPSAPGGVTDADWNNRDRQPNWYGRLLRTTSLDELPQLLNILRGEMSFVGPRPERPLFAGRFSDQFPGYADRHRVPVGLTGLAQVHGLRGDTSIAHRAAFDNAYVETWSLWNDVKIILRTVGSVLRGEGR